MLMVSLETGRLILRRFRPDDWRDIQEYASQKDMFRYDHEWPSSDEGCRGMAEFLSKGCEFWAVCLRDTGKLIGHVVCHREGPEEFLTWHIGFGINPAYQGRGYATEACRRILDLAFEEFGAHRVVSHCHPDNTPAWKLLERLGLRREAHHRKAGFLRRTPEGEPIWADAYDYAMLREEWANRADE
jgi:RimJ/RimL family protein N-acetyltransferase